MKSDFKKEPIERRVKRVALFFINNRSTIRKTAEHLEISKSTVHTYLTKKVPVYYPELVPGIERILTWNWECKHMRGGLATKAKYEEHAANSTDS